MSCDVSYLIYAVRFRLLKYERGLHDLILRNCALFKPFLEHLNARTGMFFNILYYVTCILFKFWNNKRRNYLLFEFFSILIIWRHWGVPRLSGREDIYCQAQRQAQLDQAVLLS